MRFIVLIVACGVLIGCAQRYAEAPSNGAVLVLQRVGHLDSH